jgi:1-acyl-sn-glycerol-3-phosphate acyltransferase
MKYLLYPFWFLYRVWFYFLVLALIILFIIPLIITISKTSYYKYFFVLARLWAKAILFGMGFRYNIKGQEYFEDNKSYMLVANHTSMTDIMLMLIAVKNHPFVFVGKKELQNIPIFGFIYKRVCIMVDRSSSKSRFEVFERAKKRLNEGLSICIFPEGGVPEESIVLDAFKDGAFRIAIDHQLTILPMSFYDNKKRFSYTFFSGSPGKMRAKIHAPINTNGLTQDNKNELKQKVYDLLYQDLLANL